MLTTPGHDFEISRVMKKVERPAWIKENLRPPSPVQANLAMLQQRVTALKSKVLGHTGNSPRKDIIPSRFFQGSKFHMPSATAEHSSRSTGNTRSSRLMKIAPLPQFGPPPVSTVPKLGPPPLKLRNPDAYLDFDLQDDLGRTISLTSSRSDIATARANDPPPNAAEVENERLRQLLVENLNHQENIKKTMDQLRAELQDRSMKLSATTKQVRDLQQYKEITLPAMEASLLEKETLASKHRSRRVRNLEIVEYPLTTINPKPTEQPQVVDRMPDWAAEELAVAVEVRERLETSVRSILHRTGRAVAAGIVLIGGEQHFLCLNAKILELYKEPDDPQPMRRMTLNSMLVEINTPSLEISFMDGSGKFTVDCQRRTDKAEKWIAALKGLEVRYSLNRN